MPAAWTRTSFENVGAAFFQPQEAQNGHGRLTEECEHGQHGAHAVRMEPVLRDRNQAQVLAQYHRKRGGGPERIGRDLGHVQEVTGTGLHVHALVWIDLEPPKVVRQLTSEGVRHVVQVYVRFVHFLFLRPPTTHLVHPT